VQIDKKRLCYNTKMPARRKQIAIALAALFLLAISLPYIFAQGQSDADAGFGGFLQNPIDGNSYLAKMRQGYNGAWMFTLPYGAEPGRGAFINVYYLLLGHLARWFHIPLILAFHLARLGGAAAMCLALYRLFVVIFPDSPAGLWAYGLALFGSGLGWLVVALGFFSSDFWVDEAYPFLAAFTNPHFALGLALQIGLLTPMAERPRRLLWMALGGLLLSIMYPFGWAVAAAVLAVAALAKAASWRQAAAVAVGGAPYALYALLSINNDPQLAAWNAQNLTPAPALADLLVSLSPALILALIGCYFALKGKQRGFYILIVWLLTALALVYIPTNLQRRLISGLYVPIAGLAVVAIYELLKRPKIALLSLMLLSLPTNLLVILGGINAASRQDPNLYIDRDELAAFAWLEATQPDALVLAAPQTGLLIPAYSDSRVLYGHPFETPNAEKQRALVENFFRAGNGQLLDLDHFDLIFYGPREAGLGILPAMPGWQPAFTSGDVSIYAPGQP
jgi:hypothetical protein